MSKDYRTFSSFFNAFKGAVSNFDETRIWVETKGKVYSGLHICFVEDGKLKRCHVYCTDYYLNLWKDHFIEYLETGKFPWFCYCKIIVEGQVHEFKKFPLTKNYGNDCYWHSPELNEYLIQLRKDFGGNSGLEQISKTEYEQGII